MLPRGLYLGFAASILAAIFGMGVRSAAQTSRSGSPSSPSSHATALGTPLRTIIVFGDQYNGGDELYDVKITIAEVLRGDRALQMVRAAGDTNAAPGAGMEYLLARVRFEFAARAQPHHYDYTLEPAQFSATSASGRAYGAAGLGTAVKPELRGVLRPGDSAEGWVAFVVPRSDHTPLMMFREDVGSVIHQGDASFFKLYGEGPGEPSASQKTSNKPSNTP